MFKSTIISHFYNEEFLLPWWLSHHKDMFSDGILINYGSTDNSVNIIKEICPHWQIVESRNKSFDCIAVDEEVMDIESSISGWKLCLNTTEFLVYNDKFLLELQKSNKLFIKSLAMVDKASHINDSVTYDKSLLKQKFHGINFDTTDLTGLPSIMNRHYAKMMHNVPRANYVIGRGYCYENKTITTNKESVDRYISNNAAILWYGWAPFNEQTIKRKTQIQFKRKDIESSLGGHHDGMTAESLVNAFNQGQHLVEDLSSELKKYEHCVNIKDFEHTYISFNFLTCKKYHETKTIPYADIVGKDILETGNKYFFVGSKDAPDYPNLLKISTTDNYWSLTEKLFEVCKYHYEMGANFDWFFFGADDTFVNPKNMAATAHFFANYEPLKESLYVVGSLRSRWCMQPIDGEIIHKGGAGILINRKTFIAIVEFMYKTNFIINWAHCADFTLDMNIQIYNTHNLKDPSRQISYIDCHQFFDDVFSCDTQHASNFASIHNHEVDIKRDLQTLKNASLDIKQPYFITFCQYFAPKITMCRDF